MSKKKKKLAEFLDNTRSINFRDTNIIIENFNNSFLHYNRFKELLKGQDEESASKRLRDAGNKLYNTCEWSYKNYLYKRYIQLFKEGTIKQSESDKMCAKLSSKDCDLRYLINELNRVAQPAPIEVGIDFKSISQNAYFVNNGPKHLAYVPDPEKYLIAATEIRKFITVYLDENANLTSSNDSVYGEENAWYEFLQDCNELSDSNSYILIVGPLTGIRKEDAKSLFSIKWDIVFDFDIHSDENGLAALYSSVTGVNPLIRDLSRENIRKKLNYSATPYWVMASGVADDLSSIALDHKEWRMKYGRHLSDFLDKMHSEYTKTAKVIIISNIDERIIEKIVQDFNVAYDNGEDVDFIALASLNEFIRIDEDNFKIASLTLEPLLANLSRMPLVKTFPQNISDIKLPAKDNTEVEIKEDFYSRLEDSFEVVYKGIDITEIDDPIKTNPEEFYKGTTQISWYGLNRGFDIERDHLLFIEERINKDLQERARAIRGIHYMPGIGGSTFMRRLAWKYHNIYPVLILHNYLGEQTSKSLEKLYNIYCKLPIIVMADCNSVSLVDLLRLHRELKINNFPFIIYYFERSNQYRSDSDIFISYLPELSQNKAKEMKNILEQYELKDDIKNKLEEICIDDSEERSPFIMSMYAFDKEFKGVKSYINNFLKLLPLEAKKILAYIALSDYANESIETQFFVDLFENNDVERLFQYEKAFNSLISIINRNGKKYFKIKYPAFAQEILKQLSSGYDGISIRFSNILDYILSFIDDSRRNKYLYNRNTVELLRTLFITRVEDADSTKPAFSPLILKLHEECDSYGNWDGSKDIVARIFKKLVEKYPDEPHFIAHLARYYFYIEGDYEKGLEHINKAIYISEDTSERKDSLLYHMKAMGYSSRVTGKYIYEIKRHHKNKEHDEMNEKLELLKEDSKRAFDLFEQVREMGNGIAGYVSDINLCISVIELGRFITDSFDWQVFFNNNNDSWYIEYLDRACTLFDECKSQIDDEDMSFKETQANLFEVLGEIEGTIETWEEYLKNAPQYAKSRVRRMLARAYQNRNIHRGDWNQTEVKRIIDLMQQNIYDEPQKSGNIRIWFDAIRQLKTDTPDNILDDAIIKLNSWVLSSGSIEAYYYRFILKFIKAIDGSTSAENELPRLLRDLKNKAVHMQNRTVIHEWFGREGEGIEKLISSKEYRTNRKEDEIQEDLHLLNGRISDYYVNDNHAYISIFGIDVFFNPSNTRGEIDRSKTKQRVKFGLGFSYDGPRAYNSSIMLDSSNIEGNASDILGQLAPGQIIKCEVTKNVEYFVKVRIVGFECPGSIHIDNLNSGYNSENRPAIGKVFEAMVIQKGFDGKANVEIWELTMHLSNDLHNNQALTPFQEQLKKIKLREQ